MDVKKIAVSFQDSRGEIIDIVTKEKFEYATIITSRKHAVRANASEKPVG